MTNDQLSALIASTENDNLVSGDPGQWSFNPPSSVFANANSSVIADVDGGGTAVATPVVSPTQALVQNAVNQSNAAAATTPSAATDQDVTSQTPKSTIGSVISAVTTIGDIGDDIAALEKGGSAHLHWWGWEATLNEDATKALEHILGQDATGIAVALAALATIMPVAAAISGMLGIVAASLDGIIANADSGNGVNLKGYLWVGISVHGN